MIKRLISDKQREKIRENKDLKIKISRLEKLIKLLLKKKIISKEDLKEIE